MKAVKKSCFLSLNISLLLLACAGHTPVADNTLKQVTLETVEVTEESTVLNDFIVTEEIYTKTFEEIETFIESLNNIISEKDYETWVTHLSDDYIAKTSDPDYLRDQSSMPILKKNNISLKSLKDFFFYVVVPSRIEAGLDDIEFIDEDHVKAISIVRNKRGLLYLLVRVGITWKIGVW